MKKLYTIMIGLLATAMSHAQTDDVFAFVNAAGEVVPNGSTITVSSYEEDDFTGDVMMSSGLFVKNVSSLGAEVCQTGMTLNIAQISNGQLKHCFPTSCNYYKSTGEVKCDGNTPVLAGKQKSILSEWMLAAYGTCTVTYTVQRYSYDSTTKKYSFIADGPSVTVNYVYNEQSASIEHLKTDATHGQAYNLAGQPVDASYKGIIIRDGKKVVLK